MLDCERNKTHMFFHEESQARSWRRCIASGLHRYRSWCVSSGIRRRFWCRSFGVLISGIARRYWSRYHSVTFLFRRSLCHLIGVLLECVVDFGGIVFDNVVTEVVIKQRTVIIGAVIATSRAALV
ncbi:16197_t:CDS:2, partial [Cetraspora pellucida]